MTPERLTQLIPSLLDTLSPLPIAFSHGSPASACRWLTLIEQLSQNIPKHSLRTNLWPELPKIEANLYSIDTAPTVPLLYDVSGIPIQFINAAGVNPENTVVPALDRCHQAADYVISSTGEVAFERTDVAIPGPLPFKWKRYYRSSLGQDTGIGAGWRHSLSENIVVHDNRVDLYTAEGRTVEFKLPAIGHGCYNRFDRLLLFRQSLHSYRLTTFDQYHKVFRADGVNSALPLTEIRDQFGNVLTIDYQEGLPKKIVSSWGRVIEFDCQNGHICNLINSHAAEGQNNLCSYDYQEGQLAEVHAGLKREKYQYKTTQLTQLLNSQSGICQFSYDANGRCHLIKSNELVSSISWPSSKYRCTIKADSTSPIYLRFNKFGQQISEQQASRKLSWLFDSYGNLCEEIKADEQRIFFRYDEFGRLLRRTSRGVSNRYEYDNFGLLSAALISDEILWRYQLNDKGRPECITDPENQTWKFLYTDRGQLTQIKDPEGGKVDLAWDGQGQLQTLRREGKLWRFEYDHWQRMTALVINGDVWRQWSYGGAGELREAHIGIHQYGLDYSERGLPSAVHGDNGQSILCDYDKAGLPYHISFADGNSWDLCFSPQGQLTSLQTPNDSYHWEYDLHGQLTCHKSAQNHIWHWHYNLNGSLREYCDNDCRWYFSYNSNGALTGIRNNSGQNSEFHYDQQQRLTQANNSHSSVRFKYDRRNRVIAEHHDNPEVRDFGLRYQYDARGWLKSASSDNLDLSYTFAPCGALYGIDANGEAVLRTETKGQDLLQVQGEVRSHRKHQFGYFSALESGQALSWHFDTMPPLQLTNPLRGHQGLTQPQTESDKRGNITCERDIPGRKDYQYQYDGWGLMSHAECGEFKTYFRYDPFGRRLSKTCTHRKSTRQRRIVTTWSSLGIWGETHNIDGKSRDMGHWIHQPQTNSILCQWTTGSTEHYLTDPDGRPLAIFDAQGALQWSQGSERGEKDKAPYSHGPSTWRGTNLVADVETGLWYHPSGYWSPALGIWLNGDRALNLTSSGTSLGQL
ncbi:DUF6531 domain-containing protein [Microbulbifer sp. OS29]|uniref:DUF6531 domain-containing protein n=1 Tax=Microbulbifer okhotskensis TaxID=2926617 RepID=A0A9X2EKZ2_9GAMM|nr:DUF6531 domain-containing protein [Microbulbifer okhotskensis]MCO1332945.1 DUF6531 domain-containing protein [Microbulbifer okhotskensis]